MLGADALLGGKGTVVEHRSDDAGDEVTDNRICYKPAPLEIRFATDLSVGRVRNFAPHENRPATIVISCGSGRTFKV